VAPSLGSGFFSALGTPEELIDYPLYHPIHAVIGFGNMEHVSRQPRKVGQAVQQAAMPDGNARPTMEPALPSRCPGRDGAAPDRRQPSLLLPVSEVRT
jgi:hypothetical protein